MRASPQRPQSAVKSRKSSQKCTAVIAAEGDAAEDALVAKLLPIWEVRQVLDHWLERHPWPEFWPDGLIPPFLSAIFKRPGGKPWADWRVKVSITARWGRSPSYLPTGPAGRTGRRRAHTVSNVTCTGHPWRRSHRQRLRTNPECHRRGEALKNVVMSDPVYWLRNWAFSCICRDGACGTGSQGRRKP
jgi:hypothetical protein